MLLLLLLLLLGFCANGAVVETRASYPSLYCDFLSDPSVEDEGNYGDGTCKISNNEDEELINRKTLVTNNGETFLAGTYEFPNWAVTRVILLNFGRYHGSTRSIGIFNQNGTTGVAEIYVDIFSGNGVRMFLEVYGIPL